VGGIAKLWKRPPDRYTPDGHDLLEWAVMADPFGNELCIIRWLGQGSST
jgi:hypothetical protein